MHGTYRRCVESIKRLDLVDTTRRKRSRELQGHAGDLCLVYGSKFSVRFQMPPGISGCSLDAVMAYGAHAQAVSQSQQLERRSGLIAGGGVSERNHVHFAPFEPHDGRVISGMRSWSGRGLRF